MLVPSRVTAVVGGELPALLREATLRDVAAVVFERGEREFGSLGSTGDAVSVLVWDGDLTGETETAINRLLTECRGNLYRVGSELERRMTDLAASRAGLSELVRTASELSGLVIHVTDAQGRLLADSRQDFDASDDASTSEDRSSVERELPSGLSLILGPLRPEQRVVARFLVDRIAAAATVAARQDEAARPRGARRVEAVEAFVAGRSGNASERRAAALALGLDPDAIFFVAVSSGEDDATLTNALAPLGTVHAAGMANGRRTSLVAANGRLGPESLLQPCWISEATVERGNRGDHFNPRDLGAGFWESVAYRRRRGRRNLSRHCRRRHGSRTGRHRSTRLMTSARSSCSIRYVTRASFASSSRKR